MTYVGSVVRLPPPSAVHFAHRGNVGGCTHACWLAPLLQPLTRARRTALRCGGRAQNGFTPLHASADQFYGLHNVEFARLLLEHGADVHIRDKARRPAVLRPAAPAPSSFPSALSYNAARRRRQHGKTAGDIAKVYGVRMLLQEVAGAGVGADAASLAEDADESTTTTEAHSVATDPVSVATDPVSVATDPVSVATDPVSVATDPVSVVTPSFDNMDE